jgi:hypothetical protein
LCDSYPSIVVIPNNFNDDMLPVVAAFRTRNRLPVIVWKHPTNDSILVRCSQPMPGITKKRNKQDEEFINVLTSKCKSKRALYILDARPKVNAQANVLVGGGFESTRVYKNVIREFNNIENIHKMRDSLNKIFKIVTKPINLNTFEEEVKLTQWLDYIKDILFASFRVVELICLGSSVITHCSDGWDRTSQMVALAEVFLDPYYRTINGIIVLIEKEWCSFGHQFALRNGHGSDMADYKHEQRAPIFLQFLDSLWQIYNNYNQAFEYNEKLLIFIIDHFHSCMFGNFLADDEYTRIKEYNVREKTKSIWEAVLINIESFLNQNYNPNEFDIIITPNKESFNIRFWQSYYLHWSNMKNIHIGENKIVDITLGLYYSFSEKNNDYILESNEEPNGKNKNFFRRLQPKKLGAKNIKGSETVSYLSTRSRTKVSFGSKKKYNSDENPSLENINQENV